MMRKLIGLLILAALLFNGCLITDDAKGDKVVHIYTHRHYDVDKELFKEFEKKTGIKVKVLKDDAGKLMARIQNEGKNTQADILVTVDAGRLVKAKQEGILQPITSEILDKNVPTHLKDAEGYWYGQTIRGRVVVYSKERVKAGELSTYEDLASDKWKGRLLVRSSSNMYNQSLMASMVSHHGADSAKAWAKGIVKNMARAPKGNDRDQVKAIAAGKADIAIVNTYYIGKLLNSDNAEEVKAGESVGVFFPNQDGRGAHINISGAGITKHAKHKENAIKLLEFLSEKEAQIRFAEANYEYPVLRGVAFSDLLNSWGKFKADEIPLSELGENNTKAIELFNEAGWL
jgi:iron(III) transport system substrate-binding protein